MTRLVPLTIVALTLAMGGCATPKPVEEYGYVFRESTGQNTYLRIGSDEVAFRFDGQRSDPIALRSLRALRPEVLYANGGGDRIVLRGRFDREQGTLALDHWYLMAPFVAWVSVDEATIPHETRDEHRGGLTRDDFRRTDDFDPADPSFTPSAFERRAKLIP